MLMIGVVLWRLISCRVESLFIFIVPVYRFVVCVLLLSLYPYLGIFVYDVIGEFQGYYYKVRVIYMYTTGT